MIQSSKKILSGLFVVTLSLLLYVHTRIAIFQVSYSIQRNEKKVATLSDEYKIMKFEISKLRSLGYLDRRKKEMNLKLVTPKTVKVVSIPLETQAEPVVLPSPFVRKGFFSFVNLIKEAQAKTPR